MTQSYTTKEIGILGEKITALFLMKRGFTILERNYWRKWGELDLVASKDGMVHFIEVKTASYESREKLEYAVSHETWRPEERVHQFKIHQIHKALETWTMDNAFEGEWVIDVAAVRVVPRETYASVRFIENIVQE